MYLKPMRPICEKEEEWEGGRSVQANTAAAKGAESDALVLEVYQMGASIRS